MSVKCELCGNVFGNKNALSAHIKKVHNITYKEYYDNFLECCDHKCPFCEKERAWRSSYYALTCCSSECNRKAKSITYKTHFKPGTEAYEKLKEHKKETCLKKYGVTHQSKAKEIQEKTKQTFIEKYGADNPNKNKSVREKLEKTCLERYGVKNGGGSKKAQEKIRKTLNSHFGVEHALQNKTILEKQKQTMIERYGVENPSQSIILSKNKKHKFPGPKGIMFRSNDEVKIAEFCEETGKIWNYEPKSFVYEDSFGKTHRYIPDFEINGVMYEVKGDHLWEDDKLKLVYKKNAYYTEEEMVAMLDGKTKCMKDNNVIVILSSQIDNLRDIIK